jgi:H+-transporting ATPase
LAALKAQLTTKTEALRDGQWKLLPSADLVPGDIIRLALGNIVPADVQLTQSHNITINQAALTGESLPQDKASGDTVYSGSIVATGHGEAIVNKTGNRTYFGTTLISVEAETRHSLLEQDILRISRFLSLLSLAAVVILTIFFTLAHQPILSTIILDLSLVIAGIPVSLPTVMTLIITLGVVELSKKSVIVRRLSALEDLANVNLLFTDKTGTLTRNEINVERVIAYDCTEDDVLFYAFLTAMPDENSPINHAIMRAAEARHLDQKNFQRLDVTPADSIRKRVTTLAQVGTEKIVVTVGAPQIVTAMVDGGPQVKAKLEQDVAQAATQGYRAVVVAINRHDTQEANMQPVGLLLFADTLLPDAKSAIDFLHDNGVAVTMLTGDNAAIAQRIGAQLDLPADRIVSQILPAEKYQLVKTAKADHIVAVTGDGINDLPAVKAAHVGIAVSNALDALKGAADIVLLSPGISVISQAIIEARKIFQRLYTYSVYRLSESFRLIITIMILGILIHSYPLAPIQLILLALLNDIPIISLAYDRVPTVKKPSAIHVRQRLILSLLFGTVGLVNSLLLFFIMVVILHLPQALIQTIFFLKLAVSGHLLIYVAHTKERWYTYLPSRPVISATLVTQMIATALAAFGIFMAPISWPWIIAVWLWAFFWMEVGDRLKIWRLKMTAKTA